MIAGHFGFAAAVKSRAQATPLWALMLATVWLDIIFVPLFVAHVETVTAVPGQAGRYGGNIIFADYTHSLLGALLLSLALGLLAAWMWDRTSGLIVGAVAFSHWCLDLLTHRGDMPLLPVPVDHLPLDRIGPCKTAGYRVCWPVMGEYSDERAVWLGRHVLPHEPALRVWLRRRRLEGLEIDDVIQETYTRLIAADSIAHIRDAKSYAFQVAGSVVVDHLRRMKVVSIASVTDLDNLDMPSPEPSPERQVIDREELHRLAQLIATLPGRVRDVFTLRRVYGLSQREVAERLGIAESTVEKHMARGFLLMLAELGHGGNEPGRTSSLGSGKIGFRFGRQDRTSD